MERSFLLLVILVFGSIAHAGGNSAAAKIVNFTFNERAQAVFEIDWVKENGFLSASKTKKFAFEFHNWPPKSRRWFHQMLPWTAADDSVYPLKDVAACQRFLLTAFIKKSTVQIGQMGTVPFQPSVSTENAGVVPYAQVTDLDGVEVCFLYAAPI